MSRFSACEFCSASLPLAACTSTLAPSSSAHLHEQVAVALPALFLEGVHGEADGDGLAGGAGGGAGRRAARGRFGRLAAASEHGKGETGGGKRVQAHVEGPPPGSRASRPRQAIVARDYVGASVRVNLSLAVRRVLAERAPARFEQADDAVRVVDRTCPRTAARVLERGPQPRVRGQVRIGARGRDAAFARPAPRRRGRASRPWRAARSRSSPPAGACRSRCAPGRRRASGRWARRPAPPGATWPMQGPVETPENRASVISATVFARSRYLQRRRDLVDLFHPRPGGPRPTRTSTSPAAIAPWP